MQNIARERLHPCAASPYRSQMNLVTVTDYAFLPRLTMHALSPSRLPAELEALAQTRSSLAAAEATIPSLPGTPETFEKLKTLTREHAADLKLVFPSERTVFTKIVGDAVARVAKPTLDLKMNTLMAGADTYDGLQALRQAPQAYAELFTAVSPEYRTQVQHQIDARYNQGMQKLLIAQKAESQRFPGTQKGLADGAVWYRSFQIRFLQNQGSTEAQAISSDFLKKREAQLLRLVPDLRKDIHQAKTEDAMNSVVSSIFLLPEDRRTPAFDQLRKYISDQATASLQQPADAPVQQASSPRRGSSNSKSAKPAVSQSAASSEGSTLQLGTTYINPQIVDNIYTGHLDSVPFGEPYTKLYLYNMVENIAETCEMYFTKPQLQKLNADAVLKAQDTSAAGGAAAFMGMLQNLGQMVSQQGVQRAAQAAQDQDDLPMDAMKDSFVLMKRHYCGTPELDHFNKSAVAFIENQGAPLRGVDAISLQCQREHTDVSPKQSSNDCNCFTSAMTQSAISRAERKSLTDNVWENAQKIMGAHPNDFPFCRK